MLGVAPAALPRNGHAACTGCSLCLLVCPVWRKSHDIRLTPHGRAKALQHGATVADIINSIESCTMCGACEPACPEGIDLIGMVVGLRRQLAQVNARASAQRSHTGTVPPVTRVATQGILLAGRSLRGHPVTLARVIELLRVAEGDDDGADISDDLEVGGAISPQRLEQFLMTLRRRQRLVVADGLLARHLRGWLPRTRIVSLGAALSEVPALRRRLRATDLYVIEPRGYHADHERLVGHYHALRVEIGCAMNLDLQRIAIPATARSLPQYLGQTAADDAEQASWILRGHRVSRIVVETLDDVDAFKHVSDLPVIHIAHVADGARVPMGAA